jgi:dihydrofolate synthase/folylpolyglutamate synthase
MTDKPTEFELITAIGFEYFRRVGCDVVILETGMGGRLDSTNIIDAPLLSVITGISIDHTAFLGDTVEKIAYEKAGIIKKSTPALFGGKDGNALAVIAASAELMDAPLYVTDREKIQNVRYSPDGTTLDIGNRRDLSLSLLGSYQPLNAANVLSAVDILTKRGLEIGEEAIRAGLASTVWHARFELLSKDPIIIYDGAHNPEGISAAVSSISEYFPDRKVNVLSGVMKDKDHGVIAAELERVAARAYTVTPNNPRALSAEEYAAQLRSFGIEATPFENVSEALGAAIADSKKTNTPLVCLGSLYMYCELMDAFEKMI